MENKQPDEVYVLELNMIKPKNVKKSDKYSSQIYKYLKHNPNYRKVWFDTSSYDIDSGKCVNESFDINSINMRNIYFGIPACDSTICIRGKCVMGLVSGNRGSQVTYSYIGNKNSYYIDITKEFYEKYIEIGRCIYGHNRYIRDEDEKFTYISEKHRKCNWCGKEEYLETKTYSHTRDEWIEKDTE